MYKPEAHNSLSPYLLLEDVPAALDFIRQVFGAEPTLIHRRDDGAIGHAEVKIDDSVLMMGQAPGSAGSHIHLYVPDVDAVFAAAEKRPAAPSSSHRKKKAMVTVAAVSPTRPARPGGWPPTSARPEAK